MREDFLIRIQGSVEQDGEQDTIHLMTRGSFVQKNDHFFISYLESAATGFAGCTTTVKWEQTAGRVSMLRFGPAASQLVVEKGVRHLCHYDTGAGAMTFGVSADEISGSLAETGGTLRFSYTLDANEAGAILSKNEVTIQVSPSLPLH